MIWMTSKIFDLSTLITKIIRYRMKFTEFVSAFIHLHIHRFENDPNFPMGAFLEMLYKFTYNQPSVEALQDCLVIWNTFFDYLQLSKERGCAIHEK